MQISASSILTLYHDGQFWIELVQQHYLRPARKLYEKALGRSSIPALFKYR